MAIKAEECLARVTKKATVSICCYYVGESTYLSELMQRAWGTIYENCQREQIATLGGLQVRTVHGFIGQETDISIIQCCTGNPLMWKSYAKQHKETTLLCELRIQTQWVWSLNAVLTRSINGFRRKPKPYPELQKP